MTRRTGVSFTEYRFDIPLSMRGQIVNGSSPFSASLADSSSSS